MGLCLPNCLPWPLFLKPARWFTSPRSRRIQRERAMGDLHSRRTNAMFFRQHPARAAHDAPGLPIVDWRGLTAYQTLVDALGVASRTSTLGLSSSEPQNNPHPNPHAAAHPCLLDPRLSWDPLPVSFTTCILSTSRAYVSMLDTVA